MSTPVWCWQLSPAEILRGYLLSKSVPTSVSPEHRPFDCPVLPLDGALQYQLAFSSNTNCREVQILRAEHPEIPKSGDGRSGVLILENDRVIGSFTINDHWSFMQQVHNTHRGRGIARHTSLLWLKTIKSPMTGAPQMMNVNSLKTFLSAHAALIEWAVAEGKDVPAHVVEAVQSGKEAELLIRRAQLL